MLFILDVETNPTERQVTLRLQNQQGEHLAAQQVKIGEGFEWTGLLNTRQHVERYAERMQVDAKNLSADDLIAQLGVFLATEVLGEDIFRHWYEGISQRTVLIRLPATKDDWLAAALARIPWEIARPSLDKPALLEKHNFAVRAITGTELPQDREIALDLGPAEVVRVLLVFAETEDSNPLALRLEREQLLDLFYDKILPYRLVQIDSICYGVTKAKIKKQVRKANGYHIVHWSGHGNHDSLLLAGEENNKISGAGLVDLFREAGGFVPKLMFLSACHSGAFAGLEHTSTALALLLAGVPQVVAMRYSVGDEYARRLAVLFYQYLLAEQHNADAALAMARSELTKDASIEGIEHTTALLFGQDRWLLEAVQQRNAEQLKQRYPNQRFQPLLTDEQYGFKARSHFVGRSRELTRLSRDWLNESPVALVQGLAGLGKTALVAEVVNLWHNKFNLVLVVQSRGNPMNADAFYAKIDSLLVLLYQDYREDCQADEYRKIYLPKDVPNRYEMMRENLLDTLNNYPILLIIDNFETNLLPDCVCKDPEWTALLTLFLTRLRGRTRVIITSRHRINLPNPDLGFKNLVGLGPLPDNEAWLFVQSHKVLNKLWHGDSSDRALVVKVLKISHGHPLIMQRLGDLAHDRAGLVAALASLEEKGFNQLPNLVGDDAQEQERRYLEDVAIGAVDVLLERLSVDGRQLLWVATRALESVTHLVLNVVWCGLSPEQQILDGIRQSFALVEKLPPEQRPVLPELPDDIKELLDKETAVSTVPVIGPLLKELVESGLLQREGKFEKAVFSFHELVRERCTAWMDQYPADRGERDAKQIGQAYGEQYANLFKMVLSSDKETATEMGRRAITYLVRAEAFEALGSFASGVVTSTNNPQQLQYCRISSCC